MPVFLYFINISHFIYPHYYLLRLVIYPSTPYHYPIDTVLIAALNPANVLSSHIISTLSLPLAFFHTPTLSLSLPHLFSHLLPPFYLRFFNFSPFSPLKLSLSYSLSMYITLTYHPLHSSLIIIINTYNAGMFIVCNSLCQNTNSTRLKTIFHRSPGNNKKQSSKLY